MTSDRAFPPPDQDLTPPILRDHVHQALPHGPFSINPMPWDGPEVLCIMCRCGRTLRWVGNLPSDILLYWLADHNDDIFLTREQLDRKYNEQLPEHVQRLILTLPMPT